MAENPSNIVPDQIILLEGGSKLVPAASSSDSGKVLSVLNSDGDIGWAEGQGGGGTVDQTYDATSTNAQSGTAVAEAISGQASCQLVEGAGIDLTESNGSLVIAATVDQTYDATSADAQSGVAIAGALANINQVPASTQADEGKALVVDANGAPVWAAAASGGVPVLRSITCYERVVGILDGELPAGEYFAPGLYQIILSFAMSEYRDSYRHITYGFQVDHSDVIAGGIYYPVNVDSNGPFSTTAATFVRTGYIEVRSANEVSGLHIVFMNGTNHVTGSSILNHVSVQYMKVADLS